MRIQHGDLQSEQERLDKTINIVDKEIEQIRTDIHEPTDDYVKQVVNYNKAKDLRYLEDLGRKKPYFGRIDFLKDETYELDSVYIGKRGIVRSDTFDSVVVDWRAPIASLFYSGESKDAYYRTGKEIVRGEVRLKRNFAIEEGKITGIYDGALKETIDHQMGEPEEFLKEGYIDEFLAANLNDTNDSRLKDIVATIQAEQNDIIRADKERPVVVQGVAGSGKTTIALHRLSYLIYNYQDTIASKRFMVFAPNRLFLNYISEVLPELGVEDVQQSTFVEWAAKLARAVMPKGWRIIDPNKPLQLFFELGTDPREKERTWRRLQFKGSLACRQSLDAYLRFLLDEKIPFKKLSFAYNRTNQVFTIPGEEIKEIFLEQLKHLPFRSRLDALRKHLKQEINKRLFGHLRERKIDLDKPSLAKYERMIEKILDNYLIAWPTMDVFAVYREIFSDVGLLRKLAPTEVADDVLADVVESSTEIFSGDRIEPEDLAALLYIKHILEGFEGIEQFDHTVVDEAQDLSAMEITIVALLTKRYSVTIVGDIAQGIHAYRGLHDWNELLQGVFIIPRAEFYTLEQSYRSTIEIMNCANQVLEQIELPQLVMAKPVLRHGEKPIVLQTNTRNQLWKQIGQRVKGYQSEGFASIAIVAKSMDASKKAYKALKADFPDLKLLSNKDTHFPGGITIMPTYLTKGLQFDVVILLDVDESNYTKDELDTKLLYVAMTRPVHRLLITHTDGPISPLLSKVGGELAVYQQTEKA